MFSFSIGNRVQIFSYMLGRPFLAVPRLLLPFPGLTGHFGNGGRQSNRTWAPWPPGGTSTHSWLPSRGWGTPGGLRVFVLWTRLRASLNSQHLRGQDSEEPFLFGWNNFTGFCIVISWVELVTYSFILWSELYSVPFLLQEGTREYKEGITLSSGTLSLMKKTDGVLIRKYVLSTDCMLF